MIDDILSRLEGVRRSGDGWVARCPGHEDQHQSLSLGLGDDGRVLLHCHAGCTVDDILEPIKLGTSDLFPPRETGTTNTVYDYRDETGALVYQVVRMRDEHGAKTFRQRRPDGNGGYVWKMAGVRRLCYRLNELQGRDVTCIVEGEKDADRLWSLNIAATTNSGGAGKWTDEHTKQLIAAGIQRVAILADNDPPGETHARDIGRQCDTAGLFAKVILLPDLPLHGDVSDWLNNGGDKAKLLQTIKDAPPFSAHTSAAAPLKPIFDSLSDLLSEPIPDIPWIVESRIPAGGLAMLCGSPKAGKSTLARYMAYCVASGKPWLGHYTTTGPVWYVALEDQRTEVASHFRRMGATGHEPIHLLIGQLPEDAHAIITSKAHDEHPSLIIIDTLQRYINAKDLNDYAEVTTKFAPLLALCRETGAACLVVHHSRKGGEGLESILGSTALAGSVDNALLLQRNERYRALSSVQRIGPDMEATTITLDEHTGICQTGVPARLADLDEAMRDIAEVLSAIKDPQMEKDIRESVGGRMKVVSQAIRVMLRRGDLWRIGSGMRGDPYRYGLSSWQQGLDVNPSEPESE